MITLFCKEGTYFIGDPINAIRDSDAFLERVDPHKNQQIVYFGGKMIPVGRTPQREGIFDGIHVKSGLISIIPEHHIDRKDFDPNLGELIAFDDIVYVEIENGVFKIGDIMIDTTIPVGADIQVQLAWMNFRDEEEKYLEEKYHNENDEYHGGEDHDIGEW